MSLIRKIKGAYWFVQKKWIEPSLKVAQFLTFVILDQSEKHQEASVSKDQENIVDVLEHTEVQVAEVMVGLKVMEANKFRGSELW